MIIAGYGAIGGCSMRVSSNGPTPEPPSARFGFGGGSSSGGGFGPSSVVRPTFGLTVTAAKPPPPISGGTLLVTHDAAYAVVSDPERDSIYVVDLTAQNVSSTIALHDGDEPGRLVEDGAGRVHVALRSGGALATVDPAQGLLIARRNVCPAPRGVGWDGATDLVWVACATGELVALPAAGGIA